ncbi:hypothetical protein ACFSCX_17000 [Bacillus salitolerans]|uniref:Uncharacterized protein n=1 Tax=Bacillus salitolerans TaxID=1437434 RepID=A0ABW4LT21_9BACI
MKRGTTSHVFLSLLESHEQFLKNTIPKESQIHFRNANKELLIGIGAWIDHHIVELEQRAEKETTMAQSNHQAVKKIKISDQ